MKMDFICTIYFCHFSNWLPINMKVEKPGRRDPRGRRPLDHGKFFNFDPQGILADGVIFISAYYFLEALILRTLSPVSSI